MGPTKPAHFDLDTVALMRETLEEAWARLHPKERATMLKSSLAVRILETAARGERDPQRLMNAALTASLPHKSGRRESRRGYFPLDPVSKRRRRRRSWASRAITL